MRENLTINVRALGLDRLRAIALEEELKRVPGVTDACVDEGTGRAQVECAPGECRLDALGAVLRARPARAREAPTQARTPTLLVTRNERKPAPLALPSRA